MRAPLLIGGATTSKQHTAVKIAPEFSGSTVHVLDASRVVDVVSSLLNETQRAQFERGERAALQEQLRAAAQRAPRTSAAVVRRGAREPALQIDWAHETLPTPSFIGRRVDRRAARPIWCRSSTGRSSSPPGS